MIKSNILSENNQVRLNGLKELASYRRALRRTKWYQLSKKKTIKILINQTINLYELH